MGGAAVKLVLLTSAVVGVNMVAYAKVPAVKKMVDEKLEGPLPPEVYDIYRRRDGMGEGGRGGGLRMGSGGEVGVAAGGEEGG